MALLTRNGKMTHCRRVCSINDLARPT